ncbi:MAG: adenosylcobalamin-dependent ribonucleoside-diphosphate reductase [Thermus sp.]|uniref:adenosylcobalamin-dependent ribonucleoside-diphosphate reductase n=1 Tax=Thermus sp. TaxID=275 RepID=UPI0033284587
MKRFDEHAQDLAKRQYLQPEDGDILGMFRRVARSIAQAEAPLDQAYWEEKFFELMSEKRFSPGGRILAGAGTAHGNLLNCFVQGATENPPASFEGIMEVAKKLALVTKVGGGNGVNLDPYGSAEERPTRKVVGFAYLKADHPDAKDFILGLMRPSKNPDGEKEPHPLRNWVRVVYGEVSPELEALAQKNRVRTVKTPPAERLMVPDDMAGIMDALKEAMNLARKGETPKVDFSLLRPEGSPIKGSGGTSSGPVSFLVELFDNFLEWVNLGAEKAGPVATLRYVYAPVLRSIRQGGVRRGAGMATLSVDHPDILDFITAKDLDREGAEGDISTFNISVLATDAFLKAVEEDALWTVPKPVPGKYVLEELEEPYRGEWPESSFLDPSLRPIPVFRTPDGKRGVPARWLFQEIAWHAWATGEPGLIFIDRVNALSALRGLGERYVIKSTNPCGEIPLTVGEPCDLGALNLEAYVKDGAFDFEAFRRDIPVAVRFLDNVLTVNRFALKDNEEAAKNLRRLGLGVMGLADMLIRLGLPYSSEEARAFVHRVMTVLREEATKASEALAEERGPFPLYEEERAYFESLGLPPRRNVALLTVAPTGTTSMIMGVSSGIEPVFAPFVYRRIGGAYKALIHPLFKELLSKYPPHPDYEKEGGWDWEKVVEKIQENHGSLKGLPFIPKELQKVFECAHDVHPLDHVRMQSAVQRAFDEGGKYVGNSLSKTINLPHEATVEDVVAAYYEAYRTGCKGITVYRDGSRAFQVLTVKKEEKKAASRSEPQAEKAERIPPAGPVYERVGRLYGFTDMVKLFDKEGRKHSYLITVNATEGGAPIEVILTTGKAGDEANADSEALGRVVSIALQYGVPKEAIIRTLRGINGGLYGTYNGRLVASKADLIAVALETANGSPATPPSKVASQGEPLEATLQPPLTVSGGALVASRREPQAASRREPQEDPREEDQKASFAKTCPVCQVQALVNEEGCEKCQACGYSKCG